MARTVEVVPSGNNNCVDNLEWVTNSENLKYGTAQQKRIESKRRKRRRGV